MTGEPLVAAPLGPAASMGLAPETGARGSGGLGPEELQQFESVFYAMLVKQLRTSMSEDGLFPGETTDSYGVLFDQMMGQHLAQAQPLGIARMLAAYRESAAES